MRCIMRAVLGNTSRDLASASAIAPLREASTIESEQRKTNESVQTIAQTLSSRWLVYFYLQPPKHYVTRKS